MKLHFTGLFLLTLLMSAPHFSVEAQQSVTQLKGPRNATSQFSGAEYGPIDSADTLWQIASRYRQNDNLTVYQVMVAIYQLNPHAFEENNLNLLVDGATLKLPSERYIARIDPEAAKLRAQRDDSQYQKTESSARAGGNNNIKPAVPLVNQQDLSNTKTAIEQQINQLDQQQDRQFGELRQQFAASLDNVQALLDENRKLYNRVEQVNNDLMTLRNQVEGDVQAQMDEQIALQRQLLEMIQAEQAQRDAEQNASIMNSLTSPTALIIGSGVLTALLLGGLAVWLLRRPTSEPATVTAQSVPLAAAGVAAESDDFASSMAEEPDDEAELSDDELFNEDDLLDDVLSDDLEDALDDELDSFAELDDDMLVPDEEDFESGASELDQDELDSLFDNDDFSQDPLETSDEDVEAIALSSDEDNDLLDEPDPQEIDDPTSPASGQAEEEQENEPPEEVDIALEDTDNDFTADEQWSSVESEAETTNNETPVVEDDEEEKPEISIDELLEEDGDENLPNSFGMEGDSVNEEMLEKLDKEVNQQNQDLDRITDEIINEIEQLEMMGGLAAAADEPEELDEEEELETASSPSPQGIQDLDTITQDLDEIDVEDITNAQDFEDPLSDELIAQLQAEQDEEQEDQDADALADELVAELEADDNEKFTRLDALSDELLSELETESNNIDEEKSQTEAPAKSKTPATNQASAVEEEADGENALAGEPQSEEAPAQEEADLDAEILPHNEQQKDENLDIAQNADQEEVSNAEDAPDDNEEEPAEDAALEKPETQNNDAEENELADDLEPAEAQPDEAQPDGAQPDEAQPDEVVSSDGPETDNVAPESTPTESDDVFTDAESQDEGRPQEEDEGKAGLPHGNDVEATDPLDAALEDFDKQIMDDIPSFADMERAQQDDDEDFDDSLLDDALDGADDFALEQEVDGVIPERKQAQRDINELEDVPGLDDWLSGSKSNDDDAILDELEQSEFDELLGAIETKDDEEDQQQNLTLDNPDLDLNALLSGADEQENDLQEQRSEQPENDAEEDFLDVETLMDDSLEEDSSALDEAPLDLDVSLGDFSGVGEDDDVIDIDKDAGQSANLDLASVYIEMDDYEGAKELLEEVIEKGSQDQKQEAEELLRKLRSADKK